MKKFILLLFTLLASQFIVKAANNNSQTNVVAPTKGKSVTLTWDAPITKNRDIILSESFENGITQQANYTYTVTRDGAELVSGLTETQYTDADVAIGSHEYCVTVVYTEPDCTSVPVCITVNVLPVGDCNPVTNFTGTAEVYNNTLTWEKPNNDKAVNGALTGYKLYKSGELLAEINDPNTLTYTDSGMFEGTQHYCIEAIYEDCVSTQVCIDVAPPCDPPANINATSEGTTVHVTWNNSSSNRVNTLLSENFESVVSEGDLPNGWTTIDADGDGRNWYPLNISSIPGHSGNDFVTSASWSGTALTPDNYLITPALLGATAVNYWVCAQDAAWAAEHYAVMISTTGTAPEDFSVVFEETLTAKEGQPNGARGTNVQGEWYERTVQLPLTGEVKYIAFRHYNSTNMFKINIDDVTVFSVAPADFTYSLYRDGVEIAGNLLTTHYTDLNVPAGSHEYCVRSVAAHCTSDFICTTVMVTDVDNVPMTGIKVYPNPATHILNIQGDIKGVTMYNALGQMVPTKAINNQIDVSALVNGIYHLIITTQDGKQLTEKVIITK